MTAPAYLPWPELDPYFVPSVADLERSQMAQFRRFCQTRTGLRFSDHGSFHRFSIRERSWFWRLLLEWSALRVEGPVEPVVDGESCETAKFFPNLRLSYAENLLDSGQWTQDEALALIARDESGNRRQWSRKTLRDQVIRVAIALRKHGVQAGDRVVAMAGNSAEAVIACLGATAIGATWSSASPEMGVDTLLSRFGQIDPAVLFFEDESCLQGQVRDLTDRVSLVASRLPSLRCRIALRRAERNAPTEVDVLTMAEMNAAVSDDEVAAFAWPRFPFDHPLFILFSSGTTGAPKCIVHGAGGTLLEHVKEHRLHTDLCPTDRMYFHTSTGWMMWNWQLSALASGVAIVLLDGSPTYPRPDSLWAMVGEEDVTVFGTSPSYLQMSRELGLRPGQTYGLPALRAVLSTGSILFDDLYDWVGENVKQVPVESISGGTDIVGCFVLGNPVLPIYRGESPSLSLGMDVRVVRDEAERLAPARTRLQSRRPAGEALPAQITPSSVGTGELVCVGPFPSRPVGFFGDGDRSQFHEAYFAQHPGVWTHGDRVELTDGGGARILGRSDGTLNIRGVRIGPAEIYHVLSAHVPEVVEAMAIEQASADVGGSRLVLFVVLRDGVSLDRALTMRIKRELRDRASSSHVPAIIAAVTELPTTHSGKRSERAARDAVDGRPIRNLAALRNPSSLEELRRHPALR